MAQLTSAASSRKPYNGTRVTIVIAIDVGTTFSGVSYAILRPGEIPQVLGVTRFPDQDRVAGDKKVPSIMYYDHAGEVRAAGATTQDQTVIDEAEDEGWMKVEHFKLHLRPTSMELNTNGLSLSKLPPHKSALEVFGDFLGYLSRHTIDFIKETHVDGPALWSSVEDHVEFILSHPNGWEGQQQQKMRQSAVYGGLVPDTAQGHSRVKFVTEGEASFHACLASGLGPGELNPGDTFIIADAGGGTLDISSYEIEGTNPLRVQELTTSDCRFAGSIFVNREARLMLEERLKESRYDNPGTIDYIVQEFDRSTKRLFSDVAKASWVTVGGPGERNPLLGVRNGKLKLEGADVAKCFQFSVEEAIDSIKKQKINQQSNIDVWLVGGFAASPWLLHRLKVELIPFGFSIYRPDANTSKAVADGAIGFYLDHWVTSRVAKFSCGTGVSKEFNVRDPEHRRRQTLVKRQPSGKVMIGGQFECFIAKGQKVAETTTISKPFSREVTSSSDATKFALSLYRYKGDLPVPLWRDTHPDDFNILCTLEANLSRLCRKSDRRSSRGTSYWRLEFEVEFKFGLTEYEARIKWVEDGKVKYGPASIIYEEDDADVNDAFDIRY